MSLVRRDPPTSTLAVVEPVLLFGEAPADSRETKGELAMHEEEEAAAHPRKFTPEERAAITARLRPKNRERHVDALSVLLDMREGV